MCKFYSIWISIFVTLTHYSSRLKCIDKIKKKNCSTRYLNAKKLIVSPCYMRPIYVRVRVINRIRMILHNPRILYIVVERNHMIGFKNMIATNETKDVNIGNEISERVIIDSVGNDSYSAREKKEKKEAPCRKKVT